VDEERTREFLKSQMKRLRVPEWKTLLALGYGGPQNMYQLAKAYDLKYPMVHRAIKNLEEIRWVEVVDVKLSEKNMPTKIYSLTKEGLLWLLSRIPKTVHPSLVDFSENDSAGLRRTMEEKDISRLENLESQNDVYLHLLFNFDVDRIADKNLQLFPLVFGNWPFYKKIGVAQDIAYEFPETAFSTMVEYYGGHEALMDKLGTIDMLFTYKLYYNFLEAAAKSYPDATTEFKEEIQQKTTRTFKSHAQLEELFHEISKQIEKRLTESLAFIREARTTS